MRSRVFMSTGDHKSNGICEEELPSTTYQLTVGQQLTNSKQRGAVLHNYQLKATTSSFCIGVFKTCNLVVHYIPLAPPPQWDTKSINTGLHPLASIFLSSLVISWCPVVHLVEGENMEQRLLSLELKPLDTKTSYMQVLEAAYFWL